MHHLAHIFDIRKNHIVLFCASEPFGSQWTECDGTDPNGENFCNFFFGFVTKHIGHFY